MALGSISPHSRRTLHLLSLKLGRGYSRPNFNNKRKFCLTYPICQNVTDKLNWSQICELITVLDPPERSFYKKECVD